jgi:hypothetical protein
MLESLEVLCLRSIRKGLPMNNINKMNSEFASVICVRNAME